ncbi:PEP-CTERM protein-sorting domain-containing protein [Nitrosomonas marina]|uniref:PEP-CTERM protein-sorting domain-containing protein n=1 Tax=Nitrosomonas marina TaxID=917 RepID=A0A1I0ES61_9PROT|nr:CHRD domain-containing protein [Nitrosomonas marina]SET48201.1 PEP-CTERM protein-sorting domain-containing protein [Nitrosomonas marina]
MIWARYYIVAVCFFSALILSCTVHASNFVAGLNDGTNNYGGAFLELSNDRDELDFRLALIGLDLSANPLNPQDNNDVTAIRILSGNPNTNPPHALNIFGVANGVVRQDDADMKFWPFRFGDNSSAIQDIAFLMGSWDDSDRHYTGAGGTKEFWDSAPLSDLLTSLENNQLYFEVLTKGLPNGEIKGNIFNIIPQIPEPEVYAMLLTGLVVVGVAARRRQHWNRPAFGHN